jgi:hypothetical protein
MSLTKNAKIVLAIAGAGSAGSTLTGTVDTAGFEGVMFVGSMATANVGNFGKVGQGAAANGSDAADLAGSKAAPVGNGDSFAIDVYRPASRYVTVSVVRGGANSITGDVYAFLYGGRIRPTTHGATVTAAVTLSSPDAGTP